MLLFLRALVPSLWALKCCCCCFGKEEGGKELSGDWYRQMRDAPRLHQPMASIASLYHEKSRTTRTPCQGLCTVSLVSMDATGHQETGIMRTSAQRGPGPPLFFTGERGHHACNKNPSRAKAPFLPSLRQATSAIRVGCKPLAKATWLRQGGIAPIALGCWC
jgi:hypothetical protein